MFRTFDSNAPRLRTFDQRMRDSAGAFLEGELERLDQQLHEPIYNVTWGRDIDTRTDVALSDESSSFINATFAASGGVNPTGVSWIGKTSTAITGIQTDVAKTITPLNLWGMELGYTIPELESSIKVNRPIDATKHDGIRIKYQMDVDMIAYKGDATVNSFGLINSPQITATNVGTGVAGNTWALKTPSEILTDVNKILANAWAATGFTFVPTKLLLPPVQFAFINAQIVSTAGNRSTLNYLKENSLTNAQNGRPLEIVPVKWLTGAGSGGTDRMVAYTQDQSRVRIPLTPMQNTPVEYRNIHLLTYYYCRIGAVEFTNTELVAYMDGL